MTAVLMGQTGQKYVSNQNWRQAVKNKTKKSPQTLGCLAISFISSVASGTDTGTTYELDRAVYLGATGSIT